MDNTIGRSIRLLVAENNRRTQMVFQNILLDAGFTYRFADNGRVAFEMSQLRCFDAILMDCRMPGMNGFEATESIRKWEEENRFSRVPIIALLSTLFYKEEQKCFAFGMDACCFKPIDPIQIVQSIKYWARSVPPLVCRFSRPLVACFE